MTSETTRRARDFVAAQLPAASALGERLAELIDDPEAFRTELEAGLRELGDPVYAAAQEHVTPGSGPVIGVRWPLMHAAQRPLGRALRAGSSASALWLAQRLIPETTREVRLFALPPLWRSMAKDPERSWQALRRLGRGARDWVEVDSQADLWAAGIGAEPFRWAELEQLVYSDHSMERRLVGSALARMPHRLPRARRASLAGPAAGRALSIVRLLMGDADAQVQKALSWALREWTAVDRTAVEGLLGDETAVAVDKGDGYRAAVIRAALTPLAQPAAALLRARLASIRSPAGAPSTSAAATRAASFGPLAGLSQRTSTRQGVRYARAGP